MKTNIKATGISLTPAIESYLKGKISHVERFLNPADETVWCQVELGKTTQHHKQGDIFRAEINLHLAGRHFRAERSADDLYAAIDLMKDEIVGEVKSFTKRKNTLLRRGGRRIKNMLHNINPWRK